MSAETVGLHMPSVVTLDDLAAMIAADRYGHRYETSPEGALSVMPPPDSEHAAIANVFVAMGCPCWHGTAERRPQSPILYNTPTCRCPPASIAGTSAVIFARGG